ncbi:HSP20-like chaperone [Plasmopara halstedii]|uniref:HSP20-like chaperone n=1 Tax=Plasmopara halstedii TaxID=4781 RepID=A0A0P1AGU4_PLAHL|nr:HSP20-like chaperone [Plasmopara halstedii]CEG39858.1 HSP20-like chaperone [Plasmopara halstedii]|eukprot:XP_024576227.1 HSP20-like chaperone [Plasmopara halstedii]
MIKKGENSYYFTHEIKEEGARKTSVSSFGWSDSKKTVSIYLTHSAVKGLKEDQLILKWTGTSLSMDLLDAPGGYKSKSLVISSLFHEITDVTWTTKKELLTITLTKAKELPWISLNGAAKKMEDHIEYDDAFYD